MSHERLELFYPLSAKESGWRWRRGAAEGPVYLPNGDLAAELTEQLECNPQALLWLEDWASARNTWRGFKWLGAIVLIVLLVLIVYYSSVFFTGLALLAGCVVAKSGWLYRLRMRTCLERAVNAYNAGSPAAHGHPPAEDSAEGTGSAAQEPQLKLLKPSWFSLRRALRAEWGAYETEVLDTKKLPTESFLRLIANVPEAQQELERYQRLIHASDILAAAGMFGLSIYVFTGLLPKLLAGASSLIGNLAAAWRIPQELPALGLILGLFCWGLSVLLRRDSRQTLNHVVELFNAGRRG